MVMIVISFNCWIVLEGFMGWEGEGRGGEGADTFKAMLTILMLNHNNTNEAKMG